MDYGTTFLRVINTTSPVASKIGLGFTQKGTRTIQAGFAEVLVPIFSKNNALPGIRDINLSLSGRHESARGSSNAGIEANSRYISNVWGAGLVYRPVEAVKLRLKKSTSYRAPDVANALFEPLLAPGFVLDFRGGGFAIYPIDWIRGGNPTLNPEESTSITSGIEFKPPVVPGLTLSIDYHDISYINRIGQLNPVGVVVFDATFEEFRTQYTVDESGRITAIDLRPDNIGRTDSKGFDFGLDYDFEWNGNQFGFSANVTLTQSHLQDINAHDPIEAEEHVGRWVSRHGYWARLYWARSGWSLALNARTRGSLMYESTVRINPDDTQAEAATVQVETHPPKPVDLRGSVEVSEAWPTAPGLLQNLQISFGMNNIFKSYSKQTLDPSPVGGPVGAPRGTLDARGQRYYVEISKRF